MQFSTNDSVRDKFMFKLTEHLWVSSSSSSWFSAPPLTFAGSLHVRIILQGSAHRLQDMLLHNNTTKSLKKDAGGEMYNIERHSE